MKIGMKTPHLTTELLTFSLSTIIYHDGTFNIEEVKQRIINALAKERLECRIKEIEPDIEAFDINADTDAGESSPVRQTK